MGKFAYLSVTGMLAIASDIWILEGGLFATGTSVRCGELGRVVTPAMCGVSRQVVTSHYFF